MWIVIFYFSLMVGGCLFSSLFYLCLQFNIEILFCFFLHFHTLIHNEETLSEFLLVELESDEIRMVTKYI